MVDHGFQHRARCCDCSVAIVRFAKPLFSNRIDYHIARTSVESKDLFGRRAARNCSEIGDAADILHDAANAVVAIKQVVEEGNQWRALASASDVCRAKIRDHRHTQTRCQCRSLTHLPRRREFESQKRSQLALMIKSLPMTAGQLNFYSELTLGDQHRFGVQLGQ